MHGGVHLRRRVLGDYAPRAVVEEAPTRNLGPSREHDPDPRGHACPMHAQGPTRTVYSLSVPTLRLTYRLRSLI